VISASSVAGITGGAVAGITIAAIIAALIAAYASRRGYLYYQARSDLNAAGMHSNPFFNEAQNTGDMPDSSHGQGRGHGRGN